MELTLTKSKSSIHGLLEYKSAEKSVVYFENSIGIIKEEKIMLHEWDDAVPIRQIASIKLQSYQVSYFTPRTAGLLLTLCIVSIIMAPHQWTIPIIYGFLATGSFLFFYRRKKYFIQIIRHYANQIILDAKKNQLKDIEQFIAKFNNWKRFNS